MSKPAKWTLKNAKGVTGDDGTATLTADLADGATVAASITLTITADRRVRLDFVAVPGADPIVDFQAWSK